MHDGHRSLEREGKIENKLKKKKKGYTLNTLTSHHNYVPRYCNPK